MTDQIYDRLENLLPGYDHLRTEKILRIKVGWDSNTFPNTSAISAAGFHVASIDIGSRTMVLEVVQD